MRLKCYRGKCEYGLEFLITLAFLVYRTGMSIDKARGVLAFFTGLQLSKSQADSIRSLHDRTEPHQDAVRVIALEVDDRSSNSCVATRKTEETESTPLCCLCYLLFKSSCICHWHNRQIRSEMLRIRVVVTLAGPRQP